MNPQQLPNNSINRIIHQCPNPLQFPTTVCLLRGVQHLLAV